MRNSGSHACAAKPSNSRSQALCLTQSIHTSRGPVLGLTRISPAVRRRLSATGILGWRGATTPFGKISSAR